MKTAIFGFSGSGKSELYAAMAGPKAAAAGNRAMVKVPEPRLEPLIKLYTPKKITYSEIEVVDVPGGGSKSGGLGERVLNEIRSCDCYVAVLDSFSGMNDPKSQFESIETDFLVSDLAVVEKRMERIAVDKRKSKDLVDPEEEAALNRVREMLENETPVRNDHELAVHPKLKGFQFLSSKPVLYVWNAAEGEAEETDLPEPSSGVAHMAASVRLERELLEIDDLEERQMFMQDLGVTETVLDRIISKIYELLGLISFLTAGDKEVRAWPVRAGSSAPQAAGVIHSDFEKGFIRAEVLGYQDFLDCGDFKTAKDRGVMRLEGKEYIVADGDIIEFRFNV